MTRSGFRKLWLLVIFFVLASSLYAYKKGDRFRASVESTERLRDRLILDLKAGSRLSATLAEVDKLTMNEQGATMLSVLRYLGLEENSTLTYSAKSKLERLVDGTKIYLRRFTLVGDMPYPKALEQLDKIHNENRTTLNSIMLTPTGEYGDTVKLTIEGTIYGLNKK